MEKFWGHIFDRLRFYAPLIVLLLLIIFPVLVSARFVLLGILTSLTLAITAFFAFGIEAILRRAPPSSLRVSLIQFTIFGSLVFLGWFIPLLWVGAEFIWNWAPWITWLIIGTFLGGLLGSLTGGLPKD